MVAHIHSQLNEWQSHCSLWILTLHTFFDGISCEGATQKSAEEKNYRKTRRHNANRCECAVFVHTVAKIVNYLFCSYSKLFRLKRKTIETYCVCYGDFRFYCWSDLLSLPLCISSLSSLSFSLFFQCFEKYNDKLSSFSIIFYRTRRGKKFRLE